MISPILPMILLILSIITTLAVEWFGSHEHGELVSKLSANGKILHKPQSLHCSFKRYIVFLISTNFTVVQCTLNLKIL